MGARGASYEKAYKLAVRVVRLARGIAREHKEYDMSRQLLRAATSIGANLAEAGAAISDAELSAKISIAYKECRETCYWITLLRDTDFIASPMADELLRDVENLRRMLFASLRTLRRTREEPDQ